LTLDAYDTLTIPDTVPEGDGQFIGYTIEDDGELIKIYQPGEIIHSEELVQFSEIKFIPYFAQNVVEVDNMEDLLDVDSDAIVSLTADIDYDGEDVGAGIGSGEFNGILLGNGHKISNFTIDANDEQINAGLIDFSGDGCQVYDLELSDVILSTYSAYGAGFLIGESDGYTVISNVKVTNVSLDVVDYKTYNYAVAGIGGLIGTMGAGIVYNSHVDNFDSTATIDLEEVDDDQKAETIGGLVGYENSMERGGLRIIDSSITNSTIISSEGIESASVGGIIGICDNSTDFGLELRNNKVSDSTIAIVNSNSNGASCTNEIGGFIGSESNYIRNQRDDKQTPNLVVNNEIIDTEVKFTNTNTTDASTVHIGGFAGYACSDFNNSEPDGGAIYSGNSIDAKITVTSLGTNPIAAGGFFGILDIWNNGYASTYINDNYININMNIDSNAANHSNIGGLLGYGAIEGSAPVYICRNIVDGILKADDGSVESIENYSTTGGYIGYFLNADSDVIIEKAFISLQVTCENFASSIFYYENDAMGDSESCSITIGEMYVDNNSILGNVNEELETVIDVDSDFFTITGFSSYYWEVIDGAVCLK